MSWIAKIADCLDRAQRNFGVEALAEVLPQAWERHSGYRIAYDPADRRIVAGWGPRLDYRSRTLID